MRVLVVEDEAELLSAVAQALREEGYAVDEAVDGEEAQYKVTTWDYDAVILDLMLPKVDGWVVLRQMRRKQKTPVLILSARDAVEDRVRGLDLGADDYLVKPFALKELLARLQALIRRSQGHAVPFLDVNGVRIDLRSRSVHLDERLVDLTAREFAILELLAMRRGTVVSKTEIYDHIFDENDDSLSNLLEVHVSNLRKKLGKEFIKTRRGMGYVVDD